MDHHGVPALPQLLHSEPLGHRVVREDAQADQLSEELDFSYSHDTLTGLLNRSLFETDLRTL